MRDVLLREQRVTVAKNADRIVGLMAETPGWINQLYISHPRSCGGASARRC